MKNYILVEIYISNRMKRGFIFLVFLLTYQVSQAQYVRFVDRYDREVKDTTEFSYTYFELIREFGSTVKIERFTRDSVKVSDATTLFDSLGNVEGWRKKEYFLSGNVKSTHKEDKVKEEVEQIRYYENEVVKSQTFYREGHLVNEVYFDKEGQSIVKPESRDASPGEMEAWNQYMIRNLSYPQAARYSKAEGTVIVICTVDVEGNLLYPEILNKGECHPSIEQEALRLVEKYPDRFVPAMEDGEIVESFYRLPIRFKLS